MVSAPRSVLSTGLAAPVGINDEMEGLGGLLGVLAAVGGEEVVSSDMTCAAERLRTSLKAARCKGDSAESRQSCCGVQKGVGRARLCGFPAS